MDEADGSGPLTREEARELYREMARWYYRSGNGMLLTSATLGLYTEVRRGLDEYAVGKGQRRAERCMDDVSLLRQQMRLDLRAISGRPYYSNELEEGDIQLLTAARIRHPQRWALPWYRRFGRRSTDGVTGAAPPGP